ncbi:MAG: hypothetical protein RQM90_10240 [Methanoculleus sp.]
MPSRCELPGYDLDLDVVDCALLVEGFEQRECCRIVGPHAAAEVVISHGSPVVCGGF